MKKPTLFDTSFGKASSLNNQAKQALRFLSENFKLVVLSDDDLKNLANLKSVISTPIDNLYHHILDAGKLDRYLILDLSATASEDTPEILTLHEMSIDGNQLGSNVPDNLKKLWVNVTPIASRRRTNTSPLIINDLSKLQGLVVRGSLTMSYDSSDTWLTPKLASFIIESYSITISALIKRTYNLDLADTTFVQTLFAIYYAQLLGPNNGDLKRPPLLNRCGWLSSMGELDRILDSIAPYRDNDSDDVLDPTKIANILSKVGPSRMKNFNINSLYRFVSMGPMDSQSMMIAVDYPPYWVYQVLKTLSGAKNPILNTIIRANKLNKKAMEFASDLNYSRYIEAL